MTLKCGTENAFIGKTCAETDIFDGHGGVLQQIFGRGNTCVDDVLMGGKACVFLKDADEVILTEASQLRQPFHSEILGKMFVDVGNNIFYNMSMIGVIGRQGCK